MKWFLVVLLCSLTACSSNSEFVSYDKEQVREYAEFVNFNIEIPDKLPFEPEKITVAAEEVHNDGEKLIRGNWDVFINDSTESEFLQWFQEGLSEDDFAYLQSLDFHIDIELNEQLIRLFHASPRSEFERILPWHDIERRLSMFENSHHTNSGERTPDMVVYGDIHTTFLQTYNKGILCNVGSVGNSLDLTSASYAVLDGEQGTNAIQFIRVDYDREKELDTAKGMGLPDFDKYYNEILYAKYRNG